VAGVLERN